MPQLLSHLSSTSSAVRVKLQNPEQPHAPGPPHGRMIEDVVMMPHSLLLLLVNGNTFGRFVLSETI